MTRWKDIRRLLTGRRTPRPGDNDASTDSELDIGLVERIGPHVWSECSDDEISLDIVFVHGLRGDPLRTWSKDTSAGKICWPRDLLGQDLKNARIVSWGYDANVANLLSAASQASIFGHAQTLLEDLAGVRQDKTRPVMFVGHSLGGLVIKEAIILAARNAKHLRHQDLGDIYTAVVGVIFLGTPHRGSDLESLGQVVASIAKASFRRPNTQLLGSLSSNSHILEKQRDDFVTVSKDLQVVCFYEEQPMIVGLVVPQASAVYDGFNVRADKINADHRAMAQYSSRDDIGYRRVLSHMKRILAAHEEARREQDAQRDRRARAYLTGFLHFEGMDMREDSIEDAHASTFSWLLDHTKQEPKRDDEDDECDQEKAKGSNGITFESGNPFTSWLRGDSQPIFWVSGKAGSGKSTLMKWVYAQSRTVEFLQEWAQKNRLLLCRFFLLERGTSLQNSREGMLRTVISQLVEANTELAAIAYPQLSDLDYDHTTSMTSVQTEWTHLKDAFNRIIDFSCSQGWKVCIFVDGLDEYRNMEREGNYTEEELGMFYGSDENDSGWGVNTAISDDQREISRFFVDLGKRQPGIKLCLSSRELLVFEQAFDKYPRIRVQDCTKNDIIKYTSDRLSQLELSFDEQQYFVDQITTKSRGVFLWVKLVTNIILDGHTNGDDVESLKEVLDSAPSQLCGGKGLYMRMMQLVRRDYLLESSRMFRLVNSRVGRLFPEPMSFALQCFRKGEPDFHQTFKMPISMENHVDLVSMRKAFLRKLKSRSGGLLEAEPPLFNVDFMHQTAKEFISRPLIWDTIFPKDSRFKPILSLFAGYIMEIKARGNQMLDQSPSPGRGSIMRVQPMDHEHEYEAPAHTHAGFGPAWGLVLEARHYSHFAGERNHHVLFELFDELDRTMQSISTLIPASSCKDCPRKSLWFHFDPVDPGYLYSSFLSYFAAEWDTAKYVKSKLSQIQDQTAKLQTSQSILTDFAALDRSRAMNISFRDMNWFGNHFRLREGSIAAVAAVLRVGGPDVRAVWTSWIRFGYQCLRRHPMKYRASNAEDKIIIKWDIGDVGPVTQRAQWINISQLFLEHGADPYQLVEVKFKMPERGWVSKTVDFVVVLQDLLDSTIVDGAEYKESIEEVLGGIQSDSQGKRRAYLEDGHDKVEVDWDWEMCLRVG